MVLNQSSNIRQMCFAWILAFARMTEARPGVNVHCRGGFPTRSAHQPPIYTGKNHGIPRTIPSPVATGEG